MNVIESEKQFNEEVKRKSVSILKVISKTCQDSLILNQSIVEIAEEFSDFAWFEIEKDVLLKIAEKYKVDQTPSLIVVRKGKKIAQLYSEFTKTPEKVRTFLKAVREYYQ